MRRPSFAPRQDQTVTGRYVVTFQTAATEDAISLLRDRAGIKHFARARDYKGHATTVGELEDDSGTVFDELEVCVLRCPKDAAERIERMAPQSTILSIEEEHQIYALSDVKQTPPLSTEPGFIDTANESWGIQATGLSRTSFTGGDVRVAVLDSGIDSSHPDFARANFASLISFIEQEDMRQGAGHGTHCAGIICGPRNPEHAPTFGVAPNAEMFVGKVLDQHGQGSDQTLLAGINWALANQCKVVSLSLGARVTTPSKAFEQVGRRALSADTLIIAAAGNTSARSEGILSDVGRPANNESVMAVGAIDHELRIADFSARASQSSGGEIDLVAPGVEIFSTWPLPTKYRGLTGTSMATPFVAGIAALFAEAHEVAGKDLWKRMIASARPLAGSREDVGAGLVQAPQR